MNLTGENGNGTVRLIGAAANSNHEIRFCLFPRDSAPKGNENCSLAGTQFRTDANGNANVTFQFAQKGTWAGIFTIVPGGGPATDSYDGSFDMPSKGTEFHSALKRSADVSTMFTSSPGYGPLGSDPLTGGYISISGTTAQFSLTGAQPNAIYTARYCGDQGGSSCYVLGTVNTDSSGNASAPFDYTHAVGSSNAAGIFYLTRAVQGSEASEFVSGFTRAVIGPSHFAASLNDSHSFARLRFPP